MSGAVQPLVSIAVVAYNSAPFLAELLDSIVAQGINLDDMQVIVSDDASGDDSDRVVGGYEERLPHLIYNRNDVNLGITGNCNVALDMCEGQFCIVMGGDDVLMPGRVSSGLDWFTKNPDGVLNSCGVEVFEHETGRVLGRYDDTNFIRQRSIKKIASEPTQLPTSRFMFKRERLNGLRYDMRTPVVSDWLFINEMLFLGRYGSTGQIGLRYRRHRNNATQAGVERSYMDDRLIALDIFFSNHPEMYSVCRRQRSYTLSNHGKRQFLAGNGKQAARFAGLAVRENPLNLNAYAIAGLAAAGPLGRRVAERYRRINRSG